jgi:hypothetical protein
MLAALGLGSGGKVSRSSEVLEEPNQEITVAGEEFGLAICSWQKTMEAFYASTIPYYREDGLTCYISIPVHLSVVGYF